MFDQAPVALATEVGTWALLDPSWSERVAQYFVRNREHHAPWNPRFPVQVYTEEFWRGRLARKLEEYEQDRSLALFLVDEQAAAPIASAHFNHIIRGAFQACLLGFSLDGDREGRGIMTRAMPVALRYAFETLRLHRIMANHLPENHRSARLLERLGFRTEGRAPAYLYIAGRWREHVLTALTNPSPDPPVWWDARPPS